MVNNENFSKHEENNLRCRKRTLQQNVKPHCIGAHCLRLNLH